MALVGGGSSARLAAGDSAGLVAGSTAKTASAQKAFSVLGIETILDLLTFYPIRYIDRRNFTKISRLFEQLKHGELTEGEYVVLGEITSVEAQHRFGMKGSWQKGPRIPKCDITVADDTGSIDCTFFGQPWRAKYFELGMEVFLSAKVKRFHSKLSMANPMVDYIGDQVGQIVPIYSQSAEAKKLKLDTSKVRECVQETLRRSEPRGFADPVPTEIRRQFNLVSRGKALCGIHCPEDFIQLARSRERLVFDELFRTQIWLQERKFKKRQAQDGFTHKPTKKLLQAWQECLPFKLTGAQERAIKEIEDDLAQPWPMQRLLQGDVGSGKTAVSMAAMLLVVESGHQAAIMAPTEVLAEQIYFTTKNYLAGRVAGNGSSAFKLPDPTTLQNLRDLRLAYLTSSITAAQRSTVLSDLAQGRVDIVVGTHALIQEDVVFKSLGLVVIDEQQRFGVEQRAVLQERATLDDRQGRVQQSKVPDLLVMTGTPIPRTAAMTILGDLDITELDEMPSGRAPITTARVRTPFEVDQMWEQVSRQIRKGRQVFVVCPIIHQREEHQDTLAWGQNSDGLFSDQQPPTQVATTANSKFTIASNAAANALAAVANASVAKPLNGAIATYNELRRNQLAEFNVGLLHGQMKTDEKEWIMEQFRGGQIEVLVATTMVEVGVDVPNATAMVIFDAEHFGLAQLHQLRGRVGRGGYPSKCFLVGEACTEEAEKRLNALKATSDGFELAKLDLEIRGEGTVMGDKQSGRSSWKLARLDRDEELVRRIRLAAEELVASDTTLSSYPDLWEEVQFMLREEATEFLQRT